MKLYQNRFKMSMKRNILRENRSEDLPWADFLKNEYYYNSNVNASNKKRQSYCGGSDYTARSRQSTPERRVEIPNESDFSLGIGPGTSSIGGGGTQLSNSKKVGSSTKANAAATVAG